MTNQFLLSTAAVALIAGTSLAYAQGTGRMAPAAGSGAQQSAPATNAPMNRDESSESGNAKTDMNGTQPEDSGMSREGGKHAQDNMKGDSSKSAQDNKHQDKMSGEKSKSSEMNDRNKADKDMKAEDHNSMKSDSKNAAEGKSTTTTGQAGSGAKLSTEQRTRITTVIKREKVQPVTNVNFSIAVGTRVPRTVSFHPLPAEIVEIYPAWRGYEFFLVRDEIIVVDPRTLEIVAVLEA